MNCLVPRFSVDMNMLGTSTLSLWSTFVSSLGLTSPKVFYLPLFNVSRGVHLFPSVLS